MKTNFNIVNFCTNLKQRADACFAQHHAKYRNMIGTPKYDKLRDEIRASTSTCFHLAKQHAMSCGGGVGIGPKRR